MSTCDYSSHPRWMTSYSLSIESMLKDIPQMFDRAKNFIKDDENQFYVKGFYEYYIFKYITDCNIGENTGTQTYGTTENAITKQVNDRNDLKTKNMYKAIQYLFKNDELLVDSIEHKFDADLAKKLNGFIGEDLFECGCYRTQFLGPADSTEVYLAPNLIANNLDRLFKIINNKKINSENWYVIAAEFFERFLYIHPFNNGNGRTARLLLSVLLKDITIIPISLYVSARRKNDARETYIDCIQSYRLYKEKELLHSLIIQSTYITLNNFLQALDVN